MKGGASRDFMDRQLRLREQATRLRHATFGNPAMNAHSFCFPHLARQMPYADTEQPCQLVQTQVIRQMIANIGFQATHLPQRESAAPPSSEREALSYLAISSAIAMPMASVNTELANPGWIASRSMVRPR
jgi:hypothetical protein